MHNSPIFRKSMSGYNKEDVNNYIITLSKQLKEAEADNNKALAHAETKAEEAEKNLEKLSSENELLKKSNEKLLSDVNNKNSKIEELSLQIIELQQLLAKKENEKAQKNVSEDKDLMDSFGGITDDNEKIKIFNCISSKTGEVVLSAYKVADEIIANANKEAEKIINEANLRRETVIKSIAGSADTVTTNINSYIKNAVDGCLEKIYSSIKTVGSDNAIK